MTIVGWTDLLRDDGGLNALGELYVGAKTVRTENVTTSNGATQTLNGADIPNQAVPTDWSALPGGGETRHAISAVAIALPLFGGLLLV